MIPGGEKVCYPSGASSHMGDVRVLLIVALDSQEICIHRLYISTPGLGEHRPQRSEPLCVPLEREHLGTTTIEQIVEVGKHASYELTKN